MGKQRTLISTPSVNWRLTIQEQSLQQISTELHDNVCQTLLLAIINLQQLEKKFDPEKLAYTISLLQETLLEIHQLSRSLNGDLIQSIGLHTAIQKLIDRITKVTSIQTSLEIMGEESYLPGEMEIILYRIIQEALNNVVKHSNAYKARICLRYEKEFIQISVTDDGIGFDKPHTSEFTAGLKNMAFRVRQLKGKWNIDSIPQKGCSLSFKIPLLKATL
jgi:signal transduction histidine kinase